MIKFTIVVCLAAVASAEADAQYLGHHLGYSAYAAPLRYSGAYGYAAPLTTAGITVRGYGTPATVGTYAPYGYAASGHYVADSVGAVHVAKREAEAEPEAEADALYTAYGYGLGSVYGGYSAYARPIVSSYARPVVSSYASPLAYSAAYTRPIGYSSYYGKRDAEAEPEADAQRLYNSYGYGLGLGSVYGGYSTYARPIVSSYARPVVSSIGYSAYSRPVYGGYSSYYGKREAEPEADADAQTLYNSYGYGLGLGSIFLDPVVSSIGYSAYSRPVYGGYSSYYGKREAEPEADAQYLGYSGLYSSYARPVVSSYARPVVSSYATPVVSSYATPVVSNYASPLVSSVGYASPLTYGLHG